NVENGTLPITTGATLTGNALNNTLTGNIGNDTLDGGAGADTMIGGLGNDTYAVDNLGDVITENANAGTDLINVSVSGYTLAANVENGTIAITTGATLTGNALNNVLTGNSGNDTLDGGAGADTMIGGLGNDTYSVDNLGDVVTENANEGTDLVNVSVSGYTLAANVENGTLPITTGATLTGNALNNTLTGNIGNDTLDGGAGADTMIGGLGNDTYSVDNLVDVITENANEGTDLVNVSVSGYTLAAN